MSKFIITKETFQKVVISATSLESAIDIATNIDAQGKNPLVDWVMGNSKVTGDIYYEHNDPNNWDKSKLRGREKQDAF